METGSPLEPPWPDGLSAPAASDQPAATPWYEHVTDAIFFVDAQWRIAQWNRGAEEMYGWTFAEVVGKHVLEIIPFVELISPSSLEQAGESLRQQGFWRGIYRQRSRDGRDLLVEGLARTIRDPQGAITGYLGVNRDVTERYLAAQALQSSEERFRAVVEHSAEGVMLIDAELTVSYISSAVTQILGYSRDQLHSRVPQDLTHPGDLPAFQEFMERMLSNPGQSGDLVVRARHADGSWRWLEQRVRNQLDHPAINCVIVTMRDVTERVASEQMLQASEERFRAIIENGAEGVLLVDANYQILYVSPAVSAILGYSAEEIRAQGVLAMTHPDDQALLAEHIVRLEALPNVARQITARVRHADGSWRWIERNVINRLDNPAIGAVVVSMRDVTTRVLAERALQQTAERLETLRAIDRAILAAHAPATIAQIALQRIKDFLDCTSANVVLFDANRIVQQVFSTQISIITALPPGTQLWPTRHAHWERFQRGEPSIDNDVDPANYDQPLAPLIVADGTRSLLRIPLLVQWQVIGVFNLVSTRLGAFTAEHVMIGQEIANTLAVALHNAQLVESLQQELAARERAEQALVAEHARVLQLKNEFMGTMSHELRTPLSAVLGHAELLTEQIYGPLNERQRTALGRITRSGQNLLVLINDILDYSKFEAGSIALALGPIDVAAVCRDSLQLVSEQARLKQIGLSVQIDPAVTQIVADSQRLQQMLVNLLSNAVKFSHVGDLVELEVRGDPAGRQVTFLVRDTGIGIAAKDLGRLFQPFTQLDSSLSRQYEGTGLGLALVRRIAEAHGGSVAVEGQPERGSCFSFTLPWAPEARVQAPAEPAALPEADPPVAAPQHRPAILLIEDHISNIAVLRDILGVPGYPLLVARDASEGLALARSQHPALILMDIQLPGMSGIEAIQHMRADPELAGLPIVALTALALPGDRERCLAAGADAYLPKPVSVAALLGTIERLLAR